MSIIFIADEQKLVKLPAAGIRRLARAVLEGEGQFGVSLSIAFVDDRRIREINRRYLRHDYVTDVISFPLGDGRDDLFGEVVVSTEFAAREARRRGITVGEELLRYVVHGTLHLVGYDDRTPAQKRRMWKRQEDLLGALSRRIHEHRENIYSVSDGREIPTAKSQRGGRNPTGGGGFGMNSRASGKD
ncbi:MAG: rRNA maturation RNase YbeY [Planctomycetes bacterium]|nr:rRNA maturation RNase YbeY [Planctomycetota bacterium]